MCVYVCFLCVVCCFKRYACYNCGIHTLIVCTERVKLIFEDGHFYHIVPLTSCCTLNTYTTFTHTHTTYTHTTYTHQRLHQWI